MKLATFRSHPDEPARLGAIVNDLIVDLHALAATAGEYLPDTMLEFIDNTPVSNQCAERLLNAYAGKFPVGCALLLDNVKLLAPIPKPRKNIIGIGLNYLEHVAESSKSLDTSKELPTEPIIFSKPPTAVIGPGDAIEHNSTLTQQLDWEAELAVIIGKGAEKISAENAWSHIFGYTCMIDVSARDCRRQGQWIVSKGQKTFAPMGPVVVTADEFSNKDNLNLELWCKVNGVEKQRSNTKFMLFKIPELIADLSNCLSLEAGDIIATGTPEGVGAGRDPQEWMWPGDIVEMGVQGIGELRHPIVRIDSNFPS